MRNYHHDQAEGPHQLMTGPDMQYCMHQVSLSHQGGSLEEVHALGVAPGTEYLGRSGKASYDPGGPQAGLSVGGFGSLKRAGRP